MYEIKWTSDLKFVNFIRKFLRWQIVAQWMDWMVCFMKNKHRCTMMRYDVLEYMFSFFFFLEYYLSNIISEREIWTLFDIPRYYWPILFIQNNTNSIIHQWNGISRAKRAYYFWKLCLYNDDRHSVIVRWRDLCKK